MSAFKVGDRNVCPGSGQMAYLDYAGPGITGGIPVCPVCRKPLRAEEFPTVPPHEPRQP